MTWIYNQIDFKNRSNDSSQTIIMYLIFQILSMKALLKNEVENRMCFNDSSAYTFKFKISTVRVCINIYFLYLCILKNPPFQSIINQETFFFGTIRSIYQKIHCRTSVVSIIDIPMKLLCKSKLLLVTFKLNYNFQNSTAFLHFFCLHVIAIS